MSRSSLRLVTLLFAAVAVCSPAMAGFNLVNTSAPAVNYVWSPTGTITPTDMSSGLLAGGFLQSRVFQGLSGAPAAGQWAYWYRLDLTHASTAVDVPYSTYLYLNPGTMQMYDYNFDTVATDQVFAITSGGMGSIGLSSVANAWGLAVFYFSVPVNAGQSSYFFGFTSAKPPQVGNVMVYTSHGVITVQGYIPSP